MLDPTPSPATEPADFVRARPAITRAVWAALAPELQAKAFFITGVECVATVARVRDLAASLPEGGDYKEIKDQITAEISLYLVTSDDAEERAKQQAAAARRAEVILRMQGFQAYARTQDAMLRAHIGAFPYCVYLASPDDRVRASHKALHGKIIPTDHPFWDTHTPPWEFGCRCDKAGMSQGEVNEIRDAEKGKAPEDQRVLGPEQLRQLTEHDRLVAPGGAGFIDVRTPRQKTGTGYEWKVRDEATSVDQVLERLPLADQQAFEELAANTELSDGRTLLEWWRPGKGRAKATAKKNDGKNGKNGRDENLTDPADLADLEEILGSAPVSAALDVQVASPAVVAALAAIDRVHKDGVLPRIPVQGNPGRNAVGSFHSRGPKALDIQVKASGSWPALTAVHEVGHFLDHSALGTVGKWADDKSSPLAAIIRALRASLTLEDIRNSGLKKKDLDYYVSPEEMWARAYAQYIAEESGDPLLLDGLRRIRESCANWRVWPTDEFAPIRQLITELFKSLSWI